ncbi:MAG TPA: GNAT family N-acetyltransferase, partial [Gemmatimonadales bacterium]|nr:GNAT family N-acetyltransferase [Gemmatimonadales bacterium]
ATYAGAASPLTQAFGLGLHGPLAAPELDRLEAFFRGRRAATAIELSAPADSSLQRALVARGYRVAERSDVLVCRVAEAPAAFQVPAGVTIRRADPGEFAELARVVATGFVEGKTANGELQTVIEGTFQMSTATPFAAEYQGKLSGGGLLTVHRRVGGLCGAAVLPGARGHGVHHALLEARLAAARALRCETAMVVAQPGSTSHRNAERAGFMVAYARAKYVLDA